MQPEQVARIVTDMSDLDIVINAVAYTAVDKAEMESEKARIINVDAVAALAKACQSRNVPLVHVSTDYVFDGKKQGGYIEDDATAPLNIYGRTKLAGEVAIRNSGARHIIIRTSWVYSAVGTNFVKTMLRLGRERDQLRVVADQYGSPTSAADIAATILQICGRVTQNPSESCFGVFNYAGSGTTSWYGFAKAIFDAVREIQKVPEVLPIPASDYVTPAQRPANSELNCSKIREVYDIQTVPWTEALERVLSELRS